MEELGGEGREGKKGEGKGWGPGAPFNVLPQGATDVVAPLFLWSCLRSCLRVYRSVWQICMLAG